jgi:hypothetical protein
MKPLERAASGDSRGVLLYCRLRGMSQRWTFRVARRHMTDEVEPTLNKALVLGH